MFQHGYRPGGRLLAAVLLVLGLPGRLGAVDLPLSSVLFSRAHRPLLDEVRRHSGDFATIELHYWDIYHERRGTRLHDYDLHRETVTGLARRGRWRVGLLAENRALGLDQERVYTDDDRLTGRSDRARVRAVVGAGWRGRLPLHLAEIELLVTAGGDGDFAGSGEIRLAWENIAELLVTAETFTHRLELEESINGGTFPFHFPYNTDRWFARADVTPVGPLRVRLWGLYETSAGSGEVVRGFENRTWFRRRAVGAGANYRLLPEDRDDVIPRAATPGPGFRLAAQWTDADLDLGMRFRDVRYAHLDGADFGHIRLRADVLPWPWLGLFAGWERLRASHHGDSFFDVWPFSVWDVFEARRYRLDNFDSRLDVAFAGAGGRWERARVGVEGAVRIEWWNDETAFDWLERVEVLFPFFFRYERTSESPDLSADHAVQLDLAVAWRAADFLAVRMSGRATVPFETGKDDGGPPGGTPPSPPQPAEPSRDKTHGGLSGSLEVVITR